MIRVDIVVTGDVRMVGFRTFIKNLADFPQHPQHQGSEKNNIEELINELREKPPSFASIGDISVEYADYTGEYVSFEGTKGDVPKEATLGDLLGVMQSIDAKAEMLITMLSNTNDTPKSVKGDTSLMAR